MRSYVLHLADVYQKVEESSEFCVSGFSSEICDGYAVVELQREGLYKIVNDDDIFELPVLDDSQILDVLALLCDQAVISP